eukprot:COSAG05_NODE_3504_length_2024_cov_1.375065_1_plen_51_part_10
MGSTCAISVLDNTGRGLDIIVVIRRRIAVLDIFLRYKCPNTPLRGPIDILR